MTYKGLSSALERAQTGADLAAGAYQARTSGIGIDDLFYRHLLVSGVGKLNASSEQSLPMFFISPARLKASHGLLLRLQLLLENLDLSLVLGSVPFKLHLLF